MKAQTITIIGLGRVGVSLGLALKTAGLDVAIVGSDRNEDVLQQAYAAGAIDRRQRRLVSATAEADIIVIAVPESEVEAILQTIGRDVREHALVLSLSGMKSAGQRWAEQHLAKGHFVGAVAVLAADALADGTPGVAGARADLFRGSVFCLAPSPKADPRAVGTAVNLGALLGAKPFFVDVEEYDSLVLAVETVPGLLAAALFSAVTTSSGWRDMLRFANLPFAQATLPLRDDASLALRALDSRQATLHWLDAALAALHDLRERIAEDEAEQVAAYLHSLNGERERWLEQRKRNEWHEPGRVEIKPRGFMDQFLGRRSGADN